jgi:hypothetical protein
MKVTDCIQDGLWQVDYLLPGRCTGTRLWPLARIAFIVASSRTASAGSMNTCTSLIFGAIHRFFKKCGFKALREMAQVEKANVHHWRVYFAIALLA